MLIVNSIVIVARYCHEPLVREIGQPHPTFTTLNKVTYYIFFFVLLFDAVQALLMDIQMSMTS